jgi:hypothetical protein
MIYLDAVADAARSPDAPQGSFGAPFLPQEAFWIVLNGGELNLVAEERFGQVSRLIQFRIAA